MLILLLRSLSLQKELPCSINLPLIICGYLRRLTNGLVNLQKQRIYIVILSLQQACKHNE